MAKTITAHEFTLGGRECHGWASIIREGPAYVVRVSPRSRIGHRVEGFRTLREARRFARNAGRI